MSQLKQSLLALAILSWFGLANSSACPHDYMNLLHAVHQQSIAGRDDVSFGATLQVLETAAQTNPKDFFETLIRFGASDTTVLESWWLPRIASTTGADAVGLEIAISYLADSDQVKRRMAKDIIRAISAKNAAACQGQKGASFLATFAGLRPLLSPEMLTPSFVELLYEDDFYDSFKGLWRLNFWNELPLLREQPRKDL